MKGRGQHAFQHVFVFLSRGFDWTSVCSPYCGIDIVCMKWRLAGENEVLMNVLRIQLLLFLYIHQWNCI